ncbi:MAG: GNAT family N-acetyltransferase [Bacilli bacterium]|nr:GNAT family N-acetyltransferase [Bacilli bacterium]
MYPFLFENDIKKCVEFLKKEILQDGFIFNYNNLYVAHDQTINKIVGVICAIDKSSNLIYDYESLGKINKYYQRTVEEYFKPIIEEVSGFDEKTMYVSNVCIDKNLRGKKIGTKLLGYFISQMEKVGFNRFELDCLLHNLPAKNLYHSLGFREMKLIDGFNGNENKTIEVVNFLRKKGTYLPEEFNNIK